MLFVASSFEYMNQFTLTHETAEFKVLKDIAGGTGHIVTAAQFPVREAQLFLLFISSHHLLHV